MRTFPSETFLFVSFIHFHIIISFCAKVFFFCLVVPMLRTDFIKPNFADVKVLNFFFLTNQKKQKS